MVIPRRARGMLEGIGPARHSRLAKVYAISWYKLGSEVVCTFPNILWDLMYRGFVGSLCDASRE